MASIFQANGGLFLLLAAISPLLVSSASPQAGQIPFIKQQFLIQNQGNQALEPYNLPQVQSRQILEMTPSAEATYPIQGYNIFSSPSQQDTSALVVDGWRLQVKVTTDIPLQDMDVVEQEQEGALESDDNDELCPELGELEALESKVFNTALISLLAPDNLIPGTRNLTSNIGRFSNQTAPSASSGPLANGWNVCAAVWLTGLYLGDNSSAIDANSTSTTNDSSDSSSSCAGLLSDACIADMTEAFDMAPGGNCESQPVPRSCRAFVGDAGLPAFSLRQNLTGMTGNFPVDSPIFAATTYPIDRNDTMTLKAVSDWVFPVVMSWTYNGENGQQEGSMTKSHLACVRVNTELKASLGGGGDADGLVPAANVPVVGNSAARVNNMVWRAVAVWMGVLFVL